MGKLPQVQGDGGFEVNFKIESPRSRPGRHASESYPMPTPISWAIVSLVERPLAGSFTLIWAQPGSGFSMVILLVVTVRNGTKKIQETDSQTVEHNVLDLRVRVSRRVNNHKQSLSHNLTMIS
jgi:hypothetical protein